MRAILVGAGRAGVAAAVPLAVLAIGASGAQAAPKHEFAKPLTRPSISSSAARRSSVVPAGSTAITTPADGTLLVQNLDSDPTQTFTVSGTADPSIGSVDIDCYRGGSYWGLGSQGVPVQSDGTFSAGVPRSAFAGQTCQLLAVPTGTYPSASPSYTGPRVGFSSFQTDKVGGSGSNAQTPMDFGFSDATMTADSAVNSIDDCGPYGSLLDGSSSVPSYPTLFYCAGSFYNSTADFTNGGSYATNSDLTRSEIQIDGQPAYGSDSAGLMYPGNSGLPALSATLNSFDTSNGDAQTTESESLVGCAPQDVYNPSSSQCSSFASSGVSLKRVTNFTDGGKVQTVTDTYSSTDNKSHQLSLLYETDLDSTMSGWVLPGQSTFASEPTGATGPTPTAPGTVYGIYDSSKAPSLTNPIGALTFATPYNGVRFDNTLWSNFSENSALFDYERTVKPGVPVIITWSYATEASASQAKGDAATAEAAFAAPKLTLRSPKNGALEGSRHVTVKGTANAASGIASVTVNGVAAKLSGANWQATVSLNKGKNTITALATSQAGTTSQASETVTYGPVVKIASSRDDYKAGKTKIKLICSGPSGSKCKGTLTLTKTKGGHRLGHAGYTIKTGHNKVVSVKLPKRLTGKIHANAKATVKHGGSAKRKITLVA